MVKMLGKIGDISSRVTIWRFSYEELEKKAKESFFDLQSVPLGPKITLKFSKDLIDNLVENVGKICEIEIEKGIVKSVKFYKTETRILEEFRKKRYEEYEQRRIKETG